MEKRGILETTIIGLLFGVVISAYITFLNYSGGFVGEIIKLVSLEPLMKYARIPAGFEIYGSFLYYIAVYTLYGFILGIIAKFIRRPKILIVPIILLISAATLEQYYLAPKTISDTQTSEIYPIMANVSKSFTYFGTEASGDLNGDGKDDIAFIIPRDDKQYGTIYYLSSALSEGKNKKGTGLLFLGNDVKPDSIKIEGGIIIVDYTSGSSTKQFKAEVTEGKLKAI